MGEVAGVVVVADEDEAVGGGGGLTEDSGAEGESQFSGPWIQVEFRNRDGRSSRGGKGEREAAVIVLQLETGRSHGAAVTDVEFAGHFVGNGGGVAVEPGGLPLGEESLLFILFGEDEEEIAREGGMLPRNLILATFLHDIDADTLEDRFDGQRVALHMGEKPLRVEPVFAGAVGGVLSGRGGECEEGIGSRFHGGQSTSPIFFEGGQVFSACVDDKDIHLVVGLVKELGDSTSIEEFPIEIGRASDFPKGYGNEVVDSTELEPVSGEIKEPDIGAFEAFTELREAVLHFSQLGICEMDDFESESVQRAFHLPGIIERVAERGIGVGSDTDHEGDLALVAHLGEGIVFADEGEG